MRPSQAQGKQGGAPEKKQIPRSSTPPHAKSACGGDPGYARDDNSLRIAILRERHSADSRSRDVSDGGIKRFSRRGGGGRNARSLRECGLWFRVPDNTKIARTRSPARHTPKKSGSAPGPRPASGT